MGEWQKGKKKIRCKAFTMNFTFIIDQIVLLTTNVPEIRKVISSLNNYFRSETFKK